MAELKKCPFCGGEAYSYKSKSLLGEMFWGIDCKNNECIVHTMIAEYPTEKMAIEAWNNRATEAEIRASAYDRFLTEMLNEFDSRNADIEEHTGSYVVSRLHAVAEQLKERE